MNDKQQIEEIECYLYCDRWDTPFTECEENIRCVECIAKKLYNANYRKIPKDSVVLSKEEYEKLQKGVHTINYTAMFDKAQAERIIELEERLCNACHEIRKETAREILFKFESAFAYYDNEDMFSKKAIFECVEELVKQYEVEEN